MRAKLKNLFLVPQAQLNRNNLPEILKDITALPGFDINAFSKNPEKEARYRRNFEAYRLYVGTKASLKEIQLLTGVDASQIRRLVKRVIAPHEDGLIQGLRGLVPDGRVSTYRRKAIVVASSIHESQNPAGAWQQLLESAPKLKTWLDKEIRLRNTPLKAGEIREVRPQIRSIHTRFLQQCRLVGVSDQQYPFNQDYRGLRTLQQYIKDAEAEFYSHNVIRGKAIRYGGTWSDQEAFFEMSAVQPFSVVQFDGHKIDVRLTISVLDPFGMETRYEINRIWILIFTEKRTKAALGYALSLYENYSAADFAQALLHAISRQPAIDINIPRAKLHPNGGFPNLIFPQLAYQRWGWVHFDEAKAHVAQETLDRMVRSLGTWTAVGRRGHTNDRPFQERFFGLLESSGLHSIPGSVGSRPDDPVRVLADVGKDLNRLIELEQLEQLIYVLVANLNSEVQSGLGGRTAIEAMRYFISKPEFLREPIPESRHGEVFLMRKEVIVTVRGRPGEVMHINFKKVRYSSRVLSTRHELAGSQLRCYVLERDVCQIRAFFLDGTELGMLVASRQWARTPHSLRTRSEINRAISLGKLRLNEHDDIVLAYIEMKKAEAATNKRSATQVATARNDASKLMRHPLDPGPKTQFKTSSSNEGINDQPTKKTSAGDTAIDKRNVVPTPMKIRSTLIL